MLFKRDEHEILQETVLGAQDGDAATCASGNIQFIALFAGRVSLHRHGEVDPTSRVASTVP